MKLNLCTLVQMHYSLNTAWSLGPVPLLQQDAGNVKAQTRLRFNCTHSQQSLPRSLNTWLSWTGAIPLAPAGTGETFPVCHRQLQSCCTSLPGALPSAPALMVPNAQNLKIPPKEEGSSLHRACWCCLHPLHYWGFCVVAASTRFGAQISHPAQQWSQLHQSQLSQQQMFAKKVTSKGEKLHFCPV